MSNSFLNSLTLASTPTDTSCLGMLTATSIGLRVTGSDFQKLFGRHHTCIAVASTTSFSFSTSAKRFDFDTVVGSDSLGAFNTSSVGAWFAPYQGYYQIVFNFRNNSDFVNYFQTYVMVNSVGKPGTELQELMRGGPGGKSLTTHVFTVNANDRIEIWGRAPAAISFDSGSTSLLAADLRLIERTA